MWSSIAAISSPNTPARSGRSRSRCRERGQAAQLIASRSPKLTGLEPDVTKLSVLTRRVGTLCHVGIDTTPEPKPRPPRRLRLALADNATLVGIALEGGPNGREAWNQLVVANSRAVWKALWSFGMTSTDREDAFQCTWLRALERLHQVREPEKVHVWLMSIAGHEATSILKKRGKLIAVDGDEVDSPEYPVDSDNLELDERTELARAALRRMPPDCRTLVRLLTVEELTYREIEEIMGWTNGGTAIRRHRCLEKLRSCPEVRDYLRSIGRLNAIEARS